MRVNFRPYQRESVDKLYHVWRNKIMTNPLLVLPTAAGKGTLIAGLCEEALTHYPNTRIVIATHVKELVKQNFLRLKKDWPDAPAGIFAAGLRRKDAHAPILFGSIQSMVDNEELIGGADILAVDECHLISRNPTSMYGKFIERMRWQRSHMKMVGLTATKYRLDSGMLDEPYGDSPPIFDGVAHEVTMQELLDAGFISPVVSIGTTTQYDVSKVKKSGGEFNLDALSLVVAQQELNAKVAAEACKLGESRAHWLCFAVDVDHAIGLRDCFRARGISCEAVFSNTKTRKMSSGERDRAIADFLSGKIRCLVNVDILTTGFDFPALDFIALCRPTMSPGLYIQMLGRGFRLAPGKLNCLVADFAGNGYTHGPIDQIEGVRKSATGPRGPSAAGPLMKACPNCQQLLATQATACSCGFLFPKDTLGKIQEQAVVTSLISGGKTQWRPCKGVYYGFVTTATNRRLLKVEYDVGMSVSASELIAMDALPEWWKSRSKTGLIPGDDERAIMHLTPDLREPIEVMVYRRGKYLDAVSTKMT